MAHLKAKFEEYKVKFNRDPNPSQLSKFAKAPYIEARLFIKQQNNEPLNSVSGPFNNSPSLFSGVSSSFTSRSQTISRANTLNIDNSSSLKDNPWKKLCKPKPNLSQSANAPTVRYNTLINTHTVVSGTSISKPQTSSKSNTLNIDTSSSLQYNLWKKLCKPKQSQIDLLTSAFHQQ